MATSITVTPLSGSGLTALQASATIAYNRLDVIKTLKVVSRNNASLSATCTIKKAGEGLYPKVGQVKKSITGQPNTALVITVLEDDFPNRLIWNAPAIYVRTRILNGTGVVEQVQISIRINNKPYGGQINGNGVFGMSPDIGAADAYSLDVGINIPANNGAARIVEVTLSPDSGNFETMGYRVEVSQAAGSYLRLNKTSVTLTNSKPTDTVTVDTSSDWTATLT